MDFDSPCAQVRDRMHIRDDVKKHDIHIKPKSYKIKLLEELVIQQAELDRDKNFLYST